MDQHASVARRRKAASVTVRTATRWIIASASGATVVLALVVAHELPGRSPHVPSGSNGSSAPTSSPSVPNATSGSSPPSTSQQPPVAVSGGSVP